MRGELTPAHTMTGASCMREAGTCCVQSCWRRHGKRRWMTGQNDQRLSCPSGSERGPARKQENPSLLMKKRKRRNRHFKLRSAKYNTFQPAPFSHKTKISLKLLPCDISKQFCLNSSKYYSHEL